MNSRPEAHMSDAELFALAGGDPPAAGFPADHLDSCAECADRLRVMRLRWSRLETALTAADEPLADLLPATLAEVRGRSAGKPRASMRWAAMIALVVATGLIASPVRAWVVDWVSGQWAAATGAGTAQPHNQLPSAATGQGLHFPVGRELLLDFDSPQAEGSVFVTRGDDPDAYVVLQSPGDLDPVQVGPDGLRVHNREQSAVSYRFVIPGHVERFSVRIGGQTVATLRSTEIGSAGELLPIRR